MFQIALLLILFIFLLYKLTALNEQNQQIVNKVPGPPLWPIIGNIPLLLGSSSRFSDLLQENWRKYGDRFRFVVGNKVLFFTSDVKDVETVIANTSNKSDFYGLLKSFMGTSIFLNTGEEAKRKRKILIPTFHAEVLSNYSPILEDAIGRFMKLLDSKHESDIDFNYWTQLFTIDVILETAMGVKLNVMGNEYSQFVTHFRRIFECWDERWKNVLYQSDLIYYMTTVGKDEIAASKFLSKFCDDIIKERQKVIEDASIKIEGKKISLLDALLNSKDKNGEKVSYEDVSFEVRGLMVAGHETTFTSVCLTAHLLSLNQDVQEQLYQEQIEIFGNDKNRYASTEDIKHMKILEKAIKETLRIYSIVPTIGRMAINDIHLDGVTVPKGTNIFFNLINMGTNPKYFHDPLKFDVSRWENEEVSGRSAYSTIPFSAGPRNCLGQSFAMWEIKCLLSQIMRNYKILPSETRKLELVYGLTVKPKNGLYLKMNKR